MSRERTISRRFCVLALLGLSFCTLDASAHLVSTRFGELYSGILHPLTSLSHLIPWLALGLLGALQAHTTSRWALLAFPVAVCAGAAFASVYPQQMPLTDEVLVQVNLGSLVVLGALVVAGQKLPLAIFIAICMVFGLSHGAANAAAELNERGIMLFVCGVILTAYVLVTLTTAGANRVVDGASWGRTAVRAAGSWVLAVGLILVGFEYSQIS